MYHLLHLTCYVLHSAFCSLLSGFCLLLTAVCSLLSALCFPIYAFCFLLTADRFLLTTYDAWHATLYTLPTAHHPQFTTCLVPLTAPFCLLPIVPHPSTHHSPLTASFSRRTAHYPPLHYSLSSHIAGALLTPHYPSPLYHPILGVEQVQRPRANPRNCQAKPRGYVPRSRFKPTHRRARR